MSEAGAAGRAPVLRRLWTDVTGPQVWWRRAVRALWTYVSGGADPHDGRSSALLRRQLVALPLLAVLTYTAFAWAYADVHGDSARIRDDTGPALAQLKRAQDALRTAQQEADSRLATAEGTVGGLGQAYPARIERALASLNRAGRTRALSTRQQQELAVVTALVVNYDGWVGWADSHRDEDVLRVAGRSYAQGMLGVGEPGDTSIWGRIGELRRELRVELAEQQGWGTATVAAGAVSALGCAALALALAGTVVCLHRRLRLISVPLLAGALPLLALPVLAYGTWAAHRGQNTVDAAGIRALAGAPRPSFQVPVPDAGWAAASGWILPVGLLSAAVMGLTLRAYRRDYVRVPQRDFVRVPQREAA